MLKSELFKQVIVSNVNADTKEKQSSSTETLLLGFVMQGFFYQ